MLARTGSFVNPGTVTAGRTAYFTSKLAAIHLIHEYARRLPPGVDIIGCNPGLVPGTALTRDAGALSRFVMHRVMPLLSLTPLASSPCTAGRSLADVVLGKLPTSTGDYVDHDRVAPSSKESYNRERESELWEALERLRAEVPSDVPQAGSGMGRLPWASVTEVVRGGFTGATCIDRGVYDASLDSGVPHLRGVKDGVEGIAVHGHETRVEAGEGGHDRSNR